MAHRHKVNIYAIVRVFTRCQQLKQTDNAKDKVEKD
jgi:hypothetical protein